MNLEEDYPLRQELDAEILMHRDVHFGGNFKVMLDYYASRGKGVRPEFEFEQIRSLAEFEQISDKNLALIFLNEADLEKITRAKEAYKALRTLCQQKTPSQKIPQLIAHLILSEEEEPREIEEIVKEKNTAVPALIELLTSETFHDPLFPGYGQAPVLAAKCLGRIGDKRAIISLFEALEGDDFFDEDILLHALKLIGEPAKTFLLHVVNGRPINQDNERAAIALLAFKEDPQVSRACFSLLLDPVVRKDSIFATYLVFVCDGLKEAQERDRFHSLAQDAQVSSSLRREMLVVIKNWDLGEE